MIFKDKKIVYLLISLYTFMGVSLLYTVYNISEDFVHSRRFIIGDSGDVKYVSTKLGICIFIILFGTCLIVTCVVRFVFKKPDYISAAIYSLVATIVFGEICLSTVYSSSHTDYSGVLRRMRADSKAAADNNPGDRVPEEWRNFQKNMKCCGVTDPDVEYSKMSSLPFSCCVRNSAKNSGCNATTDAYHRIGCHTKFLANFQVKNQSIILLSIAFNVLTMMALHLIRQSSLFVVKIDSNKIVLEFNK